MGIGVVARDRHMVWDTAGHTPAETETPSARSLKAGSETLTTDSFSARLCSVESTPWLRSHIDLALNPSTPITLYETAWHCGPEQGLWIRIPVFTLLLISGAALGKLLKLSEPQLPHL